MILKRDPGKEVDKHMERLLDINIVIIQIEEISLATQGFSRVFLYSDEQSQVRKSGNLLTKERKSKKNLKQGY